MASSMTRMSSRKPLHAKKPTRSSDLKVRSDDKNAAIDV
jgi:hypothetical protein